MEKRIESLSDLAHEARNILQGLAAREEGATLITLSGELGAGKTAFTKEVAKALNIEEHVTSPTFVLEKIYTLPKPFAGFSRVIHIDAYRLKDGSELAALGFDEAMSDPENLILLEWPERVGDAIHDVALRITFTLNEDGTRTLTYEG